MSEEDISESFLSPRAWLIAVSTKSSAIGEVGDSTILGSSSLRTKSIYSRNPCLRFSYLSEEHHAPNLSHKGMSTRLSVHLNELPGKKMVMNSSSLLRYLARTSICAMFRRSMLIGRRDIFLSRAVAIGKVKIDSAGKLPIRS